MQIQVQLKDIIKSTEAIDALGLNPYCINEGADGDAWYVIELDNAFKWGVIRFPPELLGWGW